MKNKFLIITVMALIMSCGDDIKVEDKEVEKVEEIVENKDEKVELTEVEKLERTQLMMLEFNVLYKELLEIKDRPDFNEGPYYYWYEKVEQLKYNPDSELLIVNNLLVADLFQLGLSYIGSKGKETTVTKIFNEIFKKELSEIEGN